MAAPGRTTWQERNPDQADLPSRSRFSLQRYESDTITPTVSERLCWASDPGFPRAPQSLPTRPDPTQSIAKQPGLSHEAQLTLTACDVVFGDQVNMNVPAINSTLQAVAPPRRRDPATPARRVPTPPSACWNRHSVPTLDSYASSRDESLSTGEIHTENMRQNAAVTAGPTSPQGATPGTEPTELTRNSTPTNRKQCLFHFLACKTRFSDLGDWTSHIEAHLQKAPPPKRSHCVCCAVDFDDWSSYLSHLWHEHSDQEISDLPVATQLFGHLQRQRVIDKGQYQDLLDQDRLDGNGAPFAVMHDPVRERRGRR